MKGQKNDYNDAEALAEAALRPNLRVVREKTQDQLDLRPSTAYVPASSHGGSNRPDTYQRLPQPTHNLYCETQPVHTYVIGWFDGSEIAGLAPRNYRSPFQASQWVPMAAISYHLLYGLQGQLLLPAAVKLAAKVHEQMTDPSAR